MKLHRRRYAILFTRLALIAARRAALHYLRFTDPPISQERESDRECEKAPRRQRNIRRKMMVRTNKTGKEFLKTVNREKRRDGAHTHPPLILPAVKPADTLGCGTRLCFT